MSLRLDNISVSFDEIQILERFSLSVASGRIQALVGPSGAGKSTVLRIIAGITSPDSGQIWIDERDVTRIPIHKRSVGLVFQDDQLFPHLDVAANIGFGLRMAKVPRDDITRRVSELLSLVDLRGYEHRQPTSLSGGEAKRVALARALAPRPRVLLLDEPLTGLDRDLHDRLAHDLRRILSTSDTTTLIVTHDRDEAAVIADGATSLTIPASRDIATRDIATRSLRNRNVAVRRVSTDEVRPLRLAVLRAGMENKTVAFDGDDDEDTVHLAAFDPAGTMIGTSTWLARPCHHVPGATAIQLRGMATAADCQGQGVGSTLLDAGFVLCRERSAEIVWANARDAALPFYERHGFRVHGEGFIEAITQLPHHVVIRLLNAAE